MAVSGLDRKQVAELDVSAGPVRVHLQVRVTSGGLLAIGALVSGILLATSVLVWTSTSVVSRHPLASRLP